MRAVAALLLLASAMGGVSCADMPLAPRAVVHVEGQVVDRDGASVPNVVIRFTPLQPLPESSKKPLPPWVDPPVRTDSEGMFRVDLAEGDYKAELYPPSNQGLPYLSVKPLTISPVSSKPVIRFTGTYLYGHVTGPDGTELANVRAQAYGPYPNSASYAGPSPFRLLLSPGVYHLEVDAGYAIGLPTLDTTVVISDRDDSLAIALTGHLVSVHVTTSQSTPLPGSFVEASVAGYYAYVTASTDLNGDARMYMRSGGYTITVDPQIPGMIPWGFFAVIQGDASLSYDLTPVRWSGTVRSRVDQSPIPFAEISLNGTDASGYLTSSFDGTFEALVRPAAPYEAQGWAPGFRSLPTFVTLSADSSFDLYLDPDPTATAPPRRTARGTQRLGSIGAPGSPYASPSGGAR